MKVKTVYIAKDGTEFEEESECLAHEASLTSECDFIQLYNHDGEPIDEVLRDQQRRHTDRRCLHQGYHQRERA